MHSSTSRSPFSALLLALLLAPALILGGCGGGGGDDGKGTVTPGPDPEPQPLAAIDVVRQVQVGDLVHRYRLFVPARPADTARMPLVISLHGGGNTAQDQDSLTRFRAKASATTGFALMTPEGYNGLWNAGACCTLAVDHVAVIAAMLDDVEQVLAIDPDRIFATGHSNGGMMAYRLACQLSDRIAAIAPNAAVMMNRYLDGNQPFETYRCEPSRPVAVLHLHGLADTCTPYQGGVSTGTAGGRRESAAETINRWVAENRCDATPQTTYSNGRAQCQTYGSCQNGADVELCTITGGGHVWPGNAANPSAGACGGSATTDLNATDRIWDFFRQHPRR